MNARTMKKLPLSTTVTLALFALVACSKEAPAPSSTTAPGESKAGKDAITIWWFQWAPADGLAELGDEVS